VDPYLRHHESVADKLTGTRLPSRTSYGFVVAGGLLVVIGVYLLIASGILWSPEALGIDGYLETPTADGGHEQVAGELTVSRGGTDVATVNTTTDDDGEPVFSVDLKPGHYRVEATLADGSRCAPVDVRVGRNQRVEVVVDC
jgi:hypothetical protein